MTDNSLYRVIPYEDLKEGEMVLALGKHIARWDYDVEGKPDYAIVPDDIDVDALRARAEKAERKLEDTQAWEAQMGVKWHEKAIIDGGSNAACEIHQALIKAGAVEPSEKLTILLAQIIVKNIVLAAHDVGKE